jgi:hypothetical protein
MIAPLRDQGEFAVFAVSWLCKLDFVKFCMPPVTDTLG